MRDIHIDTRTHTHVPIFADTHPHCTNTHRHVRSCARVDTHHSHTTCTLVNAGTETRLKAHTFQSWFGIPAPFSSVSPFQDGVLLG